jgi:hypothetical protein
MMILPLSTGPDGLARAQSLLRDVEQQRRICTLFVFRDSDDSREIASRADVRASGHPFRQVVWIPDPRVLVGEARFRWLADADAQGWDAMAATIDFRPSSRLRWPDAKRFMLLEKAFAEALAGVVTP